MRNFARYGVLGMALIALTAGLATYAFAQYDFNPPPFHDVELGDPGHFTALHAPGFLTPTTTGCTNCHGGALQGIPSFTPSCSLCHGARWNRRLAQYPTSHTDIEDGYRHAPGKSRPFTNKCTTCHGPDLRGGIALACYTHHGREWDERGPGERRDDDDDDDDDRYSYRDR